MSTLGKMGLLGRAEEARGLLDRYLGPDSYDRRREEEDYARMLLSNFDVMNKGPEAELGTDYGPFRVGLEGSGGKSARGFASTDLPVGSLELSWLLEPSGWSNQVALKNQFPMGEGSIGLDLTKGIGNPMQKAVVNYGMPVAGGNLSARATVGRGQNDQKLRELQLQYLLRLGNNFGIGAYGTRSGGNNTYGLRAQGRW